MSGNQASGSTSIGSGGIGGSSGKATRGGRLPQLRAWLGRSVLECTWKAAVTSRACSSVVGRCTVRHSRSNDPWYRSTIVDTQLIKARLLTTGTGGDDVADLDVLVGDDHPVDEQLEQLPPLLERRRGQAVAD